MANVPLTDRLRQEYDTLFNTCNIRADKAKEVESLVTKIAANQPRYAAVESELGVPWFFVGAVHCMEASLDFTCHLHNGDPLTARTVHVPAGRPKDGQPPFTWEQSATDALTLQGVDRWRDWSVPGLLYKLEGYNGFGYRLRNTGVLSPYLWSYSNHYTSGKFVQDGVFSLGAVSKQCGAAVLLRHMAEKSIIQFDSTGVAVAPEEAEADAEPLITYWTKGGEIPGARELQEFLNRLPGIFVKVDGKPAEKTSDALKRAIGRHLVGDPRAED
jgi:lysozyme family protein